VRLGRGRGFYDRSLIHRDPQARLIAVVRDEEFVDELPFQPHDVRMTHVLTPGRGVIAVGSHRE
jgi:5-formyltetrahydrofolate cyclo-ligase